VSGIFLKRASKGLCVSQFFPLGKSAVAAGSKVNRDGSKVENCILREITIDPLFGGGSEEAGA
jgi:hypothetical protein